MFKYQEAILKKMKNRLEKFSPYKEKKDLPYGGIVKNGIYTITDGILLICIYENEDKLTETQDPELQNHINSIFEFIIESYDERNDVEYQEFNIRDLDLTIKEKEVKIGNTWLNKSFLKDCIKMTGGTSINVNMQNSNKAVCVYGNKGFSFLMPINRELRAIFNT